MPYSDKDKQKKAQRKYYEANREETIARAKRNREKYHAWFLEIKKQYTCTSCGESHPACLDFHHRDKNNKTADVSDLVWQRRPRNIVLEEIKKCDVLCANCHCKLHWDDK